MHSVVAFVLSVAPSVCVLFLSWKPLVTSRVQNLEFIMIIIFKWLNSGAFGIQVYDTAHVKYIRSASHHTYLDVRRSQKSAEWKQKGREAPVFTHVNTSVSTHDVSQCKQGLGPSSQWTLGQWLSTSPVSLAAVCWSECDWGSGVVWREARRSGSWRAGRPGL